MFATGYGISDTGTAREHNEDAFFIDNNLGLYIVCDGIGGHACGEIASDTAIKSTVRFIEERIEGIKDIDSPEEFGESMVFLVQDAIQNACLEVFDKAKEEKELKGMGTTLSLLLFANQHAFIGHVGDSRIYLHRQGRLNQMTRDHTLVQELIDNGVMLPEAGYASPYSHVLSRSVGFQRNVKVDTLQIEVLHEDQFLLCSDGLTSVVHRSKELTALLEEGELSERPQAFVDAAIENNSSDNITAVIVSAGVDDALAPQQQERTSEVMLKISVLQDFYMFKELELKEIIRFVNRSVAVSCKAGQFLFRESDQDRSLYIILNGKAEVRSMGKTIAVLTKGHHLGEMALLDDHPRSCSIFISEDTKLIKIQASEFESLVYGEPVIGVRLLAAISKELSQRLRSTNEKLAAMIH